MSTIDDLGRLTLRPIGDDHPRPHSSSPYEDWGQMADEARSVKHRRWLVELTTGTCEVLPVGDLSAHEVWHGPTPGSRCMNIGISIAEEFRGQGVGGVAQALLAASLHSEGFVRVEASTDVTNVAEQRALVKAGFAYEGTLRSAQARRDGRHDLQLWSHVSGIDS